MPSCMAGSQRRTGLKYYYMTRMQSYGLLLYERVSRMIITWFISLNYREVNNGNLFHIKTGDVKETARYLLPSGVQWLGEYVLIHEPYYVTEAMFDLPVVQTRSPLIPVTTNVMSPVAVHVPEEAKEGAFYSIFGAVDDLIVKSVSRVPPTPVKAVTERRGPVSA